MSTNPVEIPLFDSDLLKSNFANMGSEAVSLLQKFAAEYVVDNKDDALVLGKTAVTAILCKEMFDLVPIPDLPTDPTMEQIAWREAFVAKRAQVFQLVAAAQRENTERVSRVTASAKSAALKILAAGFGMIFTALLGG